MGLGWSLTDAFAFSLPSPLDTMHALHGRIPASIARLPLRLRSPRAATPIVLLFLFTIILSRYPSRQDTFVRVPRESVPTTKPLSERLSTQSTFSLLSSYFDSPEYDDLEWGDNDGDYSLYAAKIAKNQRPYAQQAAAISEPASARSGRLGTAATAPKSGKKKYNNRPDPYSYRPDGLMEASSVGPHPVYELIKTSNKQWKRKLKDASKTLEEAVTEYRRRYNRLPPKGFEKWCVSFTLLCLSAILPLFQVGLRYQARRSAARRIRPDLPRPRAILGDEAGLCHRATEDLGGRSRGWLVHHRQ